MEERSIIVQRTARYHVMGDAAKAKSIWIVLHGYGHLARFFLNGFDGLEEDRFIVAPEALSRFYTNNDFTRVGASWMTREDREHEIADQISYLDSLLAQVRTACPKATEVGALGFSQGVSTLCRWTVHGSAAPDRIVIWGGSMPPELEAERLGERWRSARIDLVHGIEDPVVKQDVLARNEAALRAAGLEFNTHRFHGGHELDSVTLEKVMGTY